LDADGVPGAGPVSFVVGTGGQITYAPDETTGDAGVRRSDAASEIRIDDRAGLLLIELTPDAYLFRFVADDGAVLDEGYGWCR
jgi:hypothetical protein